MKQDLLDIIKYLKMFISDLYKIYSCLKRMQKILDNLEINKEEYYFKNWYLNK